MAWERPELPKKPDTRSREGLLSDQDVSSLDQVEPSAQNIFDMAIQKHDQTAHTRQTHPQADAGSTGFSEKNARNEAERCLQCRLICYEKTAGNS